MSGDTSSKLTSVDLFAGCGGLSRGLEYAGFETLAFNELNIDAANSFAANFPGALRLDGDIRSAMKKTVARNQIQPLVNERGGLDLLCGGPPCQGYSAIGHRRTHAVSKKEIPTNHLYKEMIKSISMLSPKTFLFENVEGILTASWYDFAAEKKLIKDWKETGGFTIKDMKEFAKSLNINLSSKKKTEMFAELKKSVSNVAKKHKDVHKGEIFRDVLASFSAIEGYTCQPTLIHAYGFGVPQNRPRVMIMGVKDEILKENDIEIPVFNGSISKSYSSQLKNNGGLFPTWDEDNIQAPNLVDVLSDLDFKGWNKEKPFYRKKATTDFQKEMRAGVQRDRKGREILTDHEFSNHSPLVVERFQYMLDHDVKKMSDLPEHLRTKKFNQKPLPARWKTKPTMTVTSLPDDYVHYNNPRTYSVREWARMQTFPDRHIFMGKRTTGGERRAGNPATGNWNREVPKYTQIGNAVPPLLAKAIGERISELIPL